MLGGRVGRGTVRPNSFATWTGATPPDERAGPTSRPSGGGQLAPAGWSGGACGVKLLKAVIPRGGGEVVAMVAAYILIQTEVGTVGQVVKGLRDVDGVRSAEGVTGPYDVIARAESDSLDGLGVLVV